jgi:hypothetical protein
MKFLKLLFPVAITTILLASCGGQAGQNNTTTETPQTEVNIESLMAATPAANHIEVIDFYGTHRCVTCRAIEANTKLALATLFPEELKSGKITFRTVNVDDKANVPIAETYQATGTALYLNVVKDGNETHVDLTEQAFAKGRERDAWAEELKFFINLQQKEMGEM